jgi:hypothetical protein
VDGPLFIDNVEILIRASIDDVGLGFRWSEHAAPPHLASGAPMRVLEALVSAIRRLILHYSSRRQPSARAFGSHRNGSPVTPLEFLTGNDEADPQQLWLSSDQSGTSRTERREAVAHLPAGDP